MLTTDYKIRRKSHLKALLLVELEVVVVMYPDGTQAFQHTRNGLIALSMALTVRKPRMRQSNIAKKRCRDSPQEIWLSILQKTYQM